MSGVTRGADGEATWDPYDAMGELAQEEESNDSKVLRNLPCEVKIPDIPGLEKYDKFDLEKLFLSVDLFRASGAPWNKVADVTAKLTWYKPTCTAEDWRHKDVKLQLSDGIAYITLNRPAENNTLNDTIMHGLFDAVFAMHSRPDIRVVVFMAEGKIFSAGMDPNVVKRMRDGGNHSLLPEGDGDGSKSRNPIKVLEQPKETQAVLEQMAQEALAAGAFPDGKIKYDQVREAMFWQTLTRLPQVTMALVEGSVMGTGIGIIACVDMAVALKSAFFCMEDLKMGLVPAIMMPHLCQKLGPSNARYLVLSAATVSGEDAKRLQLVQELAEDTKDAHARIATICESCTACGPRSVASCKELVNGVAGNPITEKVMFYTAYMLARVTSSAEAGVAMDCLLKRVPKPWEAVPIKPLF